MKKWLLLLLLAIFFFPPVFAATDTGEQHSIAHRVTALEETTAGQDQDIQVIGQWISQHENDGGSSFQVVDDLGNQVGEFLGFTRDRRIAVVVLEVAGHELLVQLNRNTIWWDERLFFTDPDCAGQPYLPAGLFGGQWFDPPLAISEMPLSGDPSSRLVFMPTGDPIPNGHDDPPFQIIRRGTPFDCINDNGPDGHYVPVGTLNRIDEPGAPVDLGQDYQPPFRLEK